MTEASLLGPSQILSYLYLGSKQDAKSLSTLQKLNIKSIINCTPKRSDDPENGCSNYYEKSKQFVYCRIPVFDNRGENILKYLDMSYKFIEENRHYGNILVHCHKGISRSVSIVIGYMMKKNDLNYEESLTHIQMFRPIAQPNESFEEQLRTYQPNREQSIYNDCGPVSTVNAQASIGPVGPSKANDKEKSEENLDVTNTDVSVLEDTHPDDGRSSKKPRVT
jgi:protein-tyrosine phosphatase